EHPCLRVREIHRDHRFLEGNVEGGHQDPWPERPRRIELIGDVEVHDFFLSGTTSQCVECRHGGVSYLAASVWSIEISPEATAAAVATAKRSFPWLVLRRRGPTPAPCLPCR